MQEAAKKRFDNDPHPPLSALELMAINALVEAEMGNMRLLVEVLDPNCNTQQPEPGERPLRSYLPPRAWQIIVDVLTGVRNPLTGRRKEDRNGKVERKRGPVHGDANEDTESRPGSYIFRGSWRSYARSFPSRSKRTSNHGHCPSPASGGGSVKIRWPTSSRRMPPRGAKNGTPILRNRGGIFAYFPALDGHLVPSERGTHHGQEKGTARCRTPAPPS